LILLTGDTLMSLWPNWTFLLYGINGLWNVLLQQLHVLVNGCPTNEFNFERGLRRQGDPLSTFLFLLIAAEGLNAMMNALVSADLFSGYNVGRSDPVNISHLQFANDTLLVGTKSWANIRSLKALLILFDVTSSLEVNFHKTMLVGVNVSDSWLNEASTVLNCKIFHVPFFYLGLPIGGDSRKLNFWKPLIERSVSRFSEWKSRNLSMGGRLALLKSVMYSLSV